MKKISLVMAAFISIIGSSNVAMAQAAPDFTFEIPAGDGVRSTMYSGTFLDVDLHTGIASPQVVLLIGEGYNTMRALGTYSCESLEMSWDTIVYNNSLVDIYDLDSFDYVPFDDMHAEIAIGSLDFCE